MTARGPVGMADGAVGVATGIVGDTLAFARAELCQAFSARCPPENEPLPPPLGRKGWYPRGPAGTVGTVLFSGLLCAETDRAGAVKLRWLPLGPDGGALYPAEGPRGGERLTGESRGARAGDRSFGVSMSVSSSR